MIVEELIEQLMHMDSSANIGIMDPQTAVIFPLDYASVANTTSDWEFTEDPVDNDFVYSIVLLSSAG